MKSRILCLCTVLSLSMVHPAVSSAQSKTAQVIVHGKSVQLQPSTPAQVVGVGTVTAYYSTFNGASGSLLISNTGIVSGELRPRTGAPGLYEGGYQQVTPLLVVDYGSYVLEIPTTDSDGNGVPDLLQYERVGNFTATGSGYSASAGLPFSTSVLFSRAAGAATGAYSASTQNSAGQVNTVSGVFSLLSYQGTVTYSRTATNSFTISVTGLFVGGTTLSGTTTYTSLNSDELTFAAFTIRDTAGGSYLARAGTLTRLGNLYRGALSLADGLPQTSWADFVDYAIQFTDTNDANGDGVPDLTDPTTGQAPTILTQPRSQNVLTQVLVTMTVSATNALTYQWRKNGLNIAGATGSNFTLGATRETDGGEYSVSVSNGSGTVVSDSATLIVTPRPTAPAFTIQPLSLVVPRGGAFMLTAEATGNPTPTYAWRRAGLAIAGATSRNLLVTNASFTNAGAYTCVATNSAQGTQSSTATILLSDSTDAGRLTNLSIRTGAGAGAQTLITGFSLGGLGTSGGKALLIRGIGPSLAQFSVTNTLQDPTLTLFSGNVIKGQNDNWAGNALVKSVSVQVGAFALTADGSKDAAIYATGLSGGSYTAQVQNVGGDETGIALVEVYDTTPAASFSSTTPRLVNVSARAQVTTGSGILIAGFVVRGTTAKTLLVRGIGPTLATFSLGGVLADPKLELYSGARLVNANDDWGSDQTISRMTTSVGGFALATGSKDAALLVTLPPGNYTAQVSGASSTQGVALVEIYELPNFSL